MLQVSGTLAPPASPGTPPRIVARSPVFSRRQAPAFVYRALQVTDLLMALLALGAAFVLLNLDRTPQGLGEFLALRVRVDKVLLLLLFGFCWHCVFRAFGLYSRASMGLADVVRVAASCTVGALGTLPFLLFSASGSFTPGTALLFCGLSIAAVLGARRAVLMFGASLYGPQGREVIIVGTGPRAQALWRTLSGPNGADAQLVGFLDSDDRMADETVRQRLLGHLGDLEGVLMRRVVDEVLIALPIKSCYQQIQETIHTCERLGVQSTYLADIFEPSLGRVHDEHTLPFPARTVKVVKDDFRLVIKRIIDVVGAALGLVVLGPLFLVIAAAIKATGPGPVFFAQQRYGLNKRLFRMYKFRTMVPDAETLQASLEQRNEKRGPIFKIARDPRVTPLGKVLRRTSLDELPQLWNVLKGEMSIVGPRPMDLRDVGRFDEGRLMRRFSVRPGLTCLWQVSGRSTLTFEQWIELDLKYIDQWSPWLDTVILFRTVPAVLSGRGAL
jgi:exopolysaccharide biosynthesis polyprenyl glycosylphosphotransferase